MYVYWGNDIDSDICVLDLVAVSGTMMVIMFVAFLCRRFYSFQKVFRCAVLSCGVCCIAVMCCLFRISTYWTCQCGISSLSTL